MFCAGCTAAPEKPQPVEATNVDHQAFVRHYFDTFNRHDWTALAAFYDAGAEFKDPSVGPGVIKQSRDQIAQKYSALAETFPDVRDELVAIYPSGERHVIVEFIATGTAPDGSPMHLPICTIFTIENGLISKDFTYYDNPSAES
jgi:ketosteroid isomerase-like protein